MKLFDFDDDLGRIITIMLVLIALLVPTLIWMNHRQDRLMAAQGLCYLPVDRSNVTQSFAWKKCQ